MRVLRRRRHIPLGIQNRMVAALLVLGVAPAVVTAVLGHWLMARAAVDVAGRQLLGTAEELAADVDGRMRKLERGVSDLATGSGGLRRAVERDGGAAFPSDSARAARRVAALEAARAADSARVVRTLLASPASGVLRGFLRTNPGLYDRLLVTDAEGVVVGATAPPSRVSYADLSWWRAAYNGGRGAMYLSRLYYADSTYLLDIAVPVMDESRTRAVGVARAIANVSAFAEAIAGAEQGETGFATLTSTSGEVLLALVPRSVQAVPADRRDRLGTDFPIWYKGWGLVPGDRVVVALAPVPSTRLQNPSVLAGTGWTISVEQSLSEVLQTTHYFGRTAVLILLFAAAIVLSVGMFLSEGITRPLRDLRDGARALGSGKLDLRLDLATGDEIEELAADFNSMAARLSESYHGLEDKVRAATAEMSRQKDSLQSIIAALGEGLMVVDSRRRILVWNQAAEHLTGYSSEEAIGQPCATIVQTGSEAIPRLCTSDCPVRSALAQRKVVARRDMSTYIVNRQGVRVPVSYTASPLIGQDGNAHGCVVVMHDITQQREIDRLKSEMVAMVSHEIRSPLSHIIGFAEVLERGEASEEERPQFLRIIVDEGRRLSGLIDDFLTLSAIEERRFELRLSDVDLHKLADEVIMVEAGHHDAHKLVNAVPRDFPRVRADADRIRRVIHNLVSNGIKYSPGGGVVRISAEERGDDVEVKVEDHGIGIRHEDVPRLFHRFSRVNEGGAERVSGTGLGLSICRSIVTEHEGSIRVESEYGKGSTFIVRLPKSGPKHARTNPTPSA